MNRQTKVKRGIVFLVILISLIALIGGTYARYTSSGTANAQIDIAKWSVKLNGQDITTQTRNVDVSLVYDENQYVSDGKIAPGRTAHFDVVLDPTGSEVAIDYTFNINAAAIEQALELGSTSKIEITGAKYKVGNGQEQTAVVDSNGLVSVSESLTQVENNDAVTVTVTLAWDNDNDSNNVSDTNEGIAAYNATNGKTITVPVSITASQHI